MQLSNMVPFQSLISSKRVVFIWTAKADIIHWHKWIIIDQHGCEVMLVKCWSHPRCMATIARHTYTQDVLRNKLSEYPSVSLVLYNQPRIAITFSIWHRDCYSIQQSDHLQHQTREKTKTA